MSKLTLKERIWAKVAVNEATGCWLWTAAKNAYGYGVVGVATGKTALAHRAAYSEWVGDIPAGLDLDHLCRVRACVRPEHLEPVTRRVNLLRGETITARNAGKTHCPQGHPYAGDNLLIRSSRRTRRCRTCDLAKKAAAREAVKLDGSSRVRSA